MPMLFNCPFFFRKTLMFFNLFLPCFYCCFLFGFVVSLLMGNCFFACFYLFGGVCMVRRCRCVGFELRSYVSKGTGERRQMMVIYILEEAHGVVGSKSSEVAVFDQSVINAVGDNFVNQWIEVVYRLNGSSLFVEEVRLAK